LLCSISSDSCADTDRRCGRQRPLDLARIAAVSLTIAGAWLVMKG
jgi:hypothetical protein